MTYLPAETRYEAPTFRRCGRSGLDLPAVSLGLWQNFGDTDVFDTGRAVLRRAFDRGGDELFDPGLFVDLPPWGFHLLAVVPAMGRP